MAEEWWQCVEDNLLIGVLKPYVSGILKQNDKQGVEGGFKHLQWLFLHFIIFLAKLIILH